MGIMRNQLWERMGRVVIDGLLDSSCKTLAVILPTRNWITYLMQRVYKNQLPKAISTLRLGHGEDR
jgi:hypothetical protein